jgi:hypothetical protein
MEEEEEEDILFTKSHDRILQDRYLQVYPDQKSPNVLAGGQYREVNKGSRCASPITTVYPQFETATISKQIELERWGWAKSLHLFVFFHNLFYLVHLHAS